VCCVFPYLWCALPVSLFTLSAVIYELIYLWSISDGMLRGSSKRSYRARSRKRRRYSGRRRTYRSYRRKRSRLSLDQRMTMIAVKNATSSKRQYGWIARDLGNLFPEVLAVKLFFSHSNSLPEVDAYGVYLNLRGYQPVVSTSANYSSPHNPLGFDRLCGASPASSIYGLQTCISVSYDVRIFIYPDASKLPEPATETGFERQFPPWQHGCYYTTLDAELYPVPSTQDLADVFMCQPKVRRQMTNGWSNGIPVGNPANSTTAYIPMEPRVCRWRGVAWTHSILGQPFVSYIGNQNNWFGPTGQPGSTSASEGALLQFMGNVLGVTGENTSASATAHRLYYTVDACFSMLFKQPHAGLYNA